MKLIVGLGNPGEKYKLNRHNIGYMIVDYLIDKFNASKVSSKFKGELFKSGDFLLLKPTTYMNSAGESVKLVKDFYKIENEDIIVIHDDIDLKPGVLKFKRGGGSGGHNGLKSIDNLIGNDYYRVRVGVGRPEKKEEVINYVLGDFEKEELECLKNRFSLIKNAIIDIKSATNLKKGC